MKRRLKKIYRLATGMLSGLLFSRTYNLEVLRNEPGEISDDVKILLNSRVSKNTAPNFLCETENADFSMYDGRQISPDVFLHEISNATVVGRTEFVIRGNRIFYPSIIDPKTDVFMAELEKKGRLSSSGNRFKITLKPRAKKVETAISLLGQCNGNYLHFLTESMTRLALADQLPELDDVPILIEKGLHPRLYEALDLLNIKGREIIFVREYKAAIVKKLIYITPPCYTPPETRTFFEKKEFAAPRMEQFKFSVEALATLRSLAVKTADQYVPSISRSDYLRVTSDIADQETVATVNQDDVGHLFSTPHATIHAVDTKRFYCDRRSHSSGNGRLVKNEGAIISVLQQHEFTSVHLPDYSFFEQVLLLQRAEIVVSPVGAAIGNLIFCGPQVDVVLLSPTYPGATFFYFANLLSALDHRLTYVLGRQVTMSAHNAYNKDFWVPVKLLDEAIVGLNASDRDDLVGAQLEQRGLKARNGTQEMETPR